MIKANSLLYAVYICLIVSVLCGALLYFATLYNQLNLFYNTREELYIQNQSAVNYALGSSAFEESQVLEHSGVVSIFEKKPFGLQDLLVVKSFVKSDTVASAHFVGQYTADRNCIYLANFSKGLTFGGTVRLIGDKRLPTDRIKEEYLNSIAGKLTEEGTIAISEMMLPQLNSRFKNFFNRIPQKSASLKDIERVNDSVYFNSFLNETVELRLSNPVLNNIVIKGNFILQANDSILVGKGAVLEDVILKAPKIVFQEGFKGSVQAFSTEKIGLEKGVQLMYPSVACVYNESAESGKIEIAENSKIYGAVVLFGNKITQIDDNEVILRENTLLVGQVYCSGKLMVAGKIYGSVWTNRFFYRTDFGNYNNCIINAEIDRYKRPSYFVDVAFFENNQGMYGIQKKVL